MYQPTNNLSAIVKSESGNLEKAIGVFSGRGFYTTRIPMSENFLITGPGKNFEDRLNYNPSTNSGVIPIWAKDSVSDIAYSKKINYYSARLTESTGISTTLGKSFPTGLL